MTRSYQDLVAEAASVSVDGWDFSWLDGRASEERPSWGYARVMGQRMARATVALDIDTGGGEVLAGVPRLAPLTVATEGWPPNVARAAARLRGWRWSTCAWSRCVPSSATSGRSSTSSGR